MIVLAYNIPRLVGDLKLDGPTLSEIYLGTIAQLERWKDLRPQSHSANLPRTCRSPPSIALDGSGTAAIFTITSRRKAKPS